MYKTTLYAFIYIIAPNDIQEFIALNSQVGGIENAAKMGEAALPHIEPAALSQSQRLLLAAYMSIYVTQTKLPEQRQKLPKIFDKLGTSIKYAEHVQKKFNEINPEIVAQWGSPLEMVFKPKDELVALLTSLVSAGLANGEYKYRKKLVRLQPGEYEHEMDQLFLNALRKTKGFETLVRLMFKHGIERLYSIQYTGSNLRIDKDQMSHVHDIIVDSCKILDVSSPPDTYLEMGFISAQTIGSEKPLLIFSSGCFGLLDYAEQVFITGHELGHIKSGHCLYTMIANLLRDGVIEPLLGALNILSLGMSNAIMFGLKMALLNWERTSELTADRAGLLCCQDIDAAIRCMMKLSGMSPMYYSSMNVEAFKQQARDFQELDFNTRDKVFKVVSIMGATHPWLVMRAHELLKWYESGEYQKVLDRTNRTGSTTNQTAKNDLPYAADSDESQSHSYCSNCGVTLPSDGKFCPQCGNPNS